MSSTAVTRLPRWAASALALSFGLIAAVAVLELLLRLAGLVAPTLLARATRPAAGEFRVLCVGDSHTYGAMVEPSDAYPARLGAELRAQGVPASVINRGIPGQNSRQVRNRLADDLLRYRPRVVLIWAGVNDSWNQGERDGGPGGFRRFLPELRVMRFARLLRRDLAQEGAVETARAELEAGAPSGGFRWRQRRGDNLAPVVIHPSERTVGAAEATRDIEADLRAMVDEVRGAGSVPILLGYPTDLFASEPANVAAERVARATAVTFVDGRRITRSLQHRGVRGLLFPDIHPTERFYRVLARELAPTVLTAARASP
jgi:lysophospholipase L1-like esterase